MKPKTQMTSFDVGVQARRLKEILLHGFVDKAYQPAKDELLIKITVPSSKIDIDHEPTPEMNENDLNESETNSRALRSLQLVKDDTEEIPRYLQYNLKIRLGKYIFAEPKSKSKGSFESMAPAQAPNHHPRAFPMLLRKHLKNGSLTDIYQYEFERIIVIEIKKRELYQLVIELFGDGNVILVKDSKIVQPLFSQSWSYRTIRANEEFKYPPARVNPLKLSEGELYNILTDSKKDLVRTLIMDMGLPGIYAEELCHRVELDKSMKAVQVTEEDGTRIFHELAAISSEVAQSQGGYLIYTSPKSNEALDFVPLKLKLYEKNRNEELDDYNAVVAQFFEPGETDSDIPNAPEESGEEKTKASEVTVSSGEHGRLQRQLNQQNQAIEKLSGEVAVNHELAEVIYTNYQRCEQLLDELNQLKDTTVSDELLGQLTNSQDIVELNPHDRFVILKFVDEDSAKEQIIKLDLRKNVIENANHYYEKSKHSKEKLRGAQKALVNTQTALKKLKTKEVKAQKHKPKQRIKKHYWFEKYHWFITSEGNMVVAGRDAKSNDQVVKKHLKDNDRYCHADISGAASVVIKSDPEAQEITTASLEEACQFAVIFSKAWHAKVGSGSAYWVKPDQVSKTPQSGEFLARGAFVIRGKRNYVGGIKLELAVGELEYNGHYKLMAGPVQGVKIRAKKYVILVPGNIKKNEMANQLSKLFNVAVDDILSILPSGEFHVVDKLGFPD
jgi:predicted ribosome quality control (RQC) complex YloA/Tae2 family protein